MNEDELRAAMQAHDTDAPDTSGFRPVVHRNRRLPIALTVATTMAIAAVTVAIATSQTSHDRSAVKRPTMSPPTQPAARVAPLHCPGQFNFHTTTGGAVPSLPQGLDGAARLAPTTVPEDVTLCAFELSRSHKNDDAQLLGSRHVTGDLSQVRDTLTWVPPVSPESVGLFCQVDGPTAYLIGLRYPRGEEWIATPSGCTSATNGQFNALVNVQGYATLAFAKGTWVNQKSLNYYGRFGQQTHMVPGSPTSLTIEPNTIGGSTRGTRIERERHLTGGFQPLVDALNAAPSLASTDSCTGEGATSDELEFGYASGPSVRIQLTKGCYPEVDNGNLQIRDGAQFFPMIEKLLNRH